MIDVPSFLIERARLRLKRMPGESDGSFALRIVASGLARGLRGDIPGKTTKAKPVSRKGRR